MFRGRIGETFEAADIIWWLFLELDREEVSAAGAPVLRPAIRNLVKPRPAGRAPFGMSGPITDLILQCSAVFAICNA